MASEIDGANAGGSATQSGAVYEARCGAYYAIAMVCGPLAQPPFGLSTSSRILSIQCQAESPVDDLVLELSGGGFAFIQVKRTISLGVAFRDVLEQFVRQYLTMKRTDSSLKRRPWARPLDPITDRLVLLTTSEVSASISTKLPRLLSRFAANPALREITDAAGTQDETRIASAISANLVEIWKKQTGEPPQPFDARQLLSAIRVVSLDLEEDQSDYSTALDRLRATILRDPAAAAQAWARLQKLFGDAHRNRELVAPDRVLQVLSGDGIRIQAPVDFRSDILKLQEFSQTTIEETDDLASIRVGERQIKVTRYVQNVLDDAVSGGHLLVTGQPGSGKSGVVHELARSLNSQGKDVVFITVDRVSGRDRDSFRAALDTENDFISILRNWPGTEPAFLIIDALDAARDAMTRAYWYEVLRSIIRSNSRWTVIASIREFDLRYGDIWRDLFAGKPVANFQRSEFSQVRHIDIPPLTDEELAGFEQGILHLGDILRESTRLKELLRNIFNLRLAVALLEDAHASETLSLIRHRVQLLSEYWRRRIHQPPAMRDRNERTLKKIAAAMVDKRTIRIDRLDLDLDGEALSEIERSHVVKGTDPNVATSQLQFSHHILFDYAVARLFLGFSVTPSQLVSTLVKDRDLALFLAPSLRILFEHLWFEPNDKDQFWSLALALTTASSVPEIAVLHAPSVVADEAVSANELTRLSLANPSPDDSKAIDRFARHLAGAIALRAEEGKSVVGDRQPWPEFAADLSRNLRQSTAYLTRIIIWKAASSLEGAIGNQLANLNASSRELLRFVWRLPKEEYEETSSRVAIEGICKTFSANPKASAELIRRAISQAHIAEREAAPVEVPEIARHLLHIVPEDPDLALQIFQTAFDHTEPTDVPTRLGGAPSQILSLTSNRGQDFDHAKWEIGRAFPKIMAANPALGTSIAICAIESYARKRKLEVNPAETGYFETTLGRGKFVRDRSYFWMGLQKGSTHESEFKILNDFSQYWISKADEPQLADTFKEKCLAVALERNQLAAIWASLVAIAAANPKPYAATVAELVAAPEMLGASETEYAIGEYLRNAFATLSFQDRQSIERGITSLGATEREERVKAKYASLLPYAEISSDELKVLSRSQQQGDAKPENRPLVRVTSSWGEAPSAVEQLIEEGVVVEAAPDRQLRDSLEILDNLGRALPRQLELTRFAEVEDTLEAARQVLEATARAGERGELWETTLDHLADLAERFTEYFDSSTDPRVRDVLVKILSMASKGLHPIPSDEGNRQFAESVGWGSPNARIEAAQGLMNLRSWQVEDAAEIEATVDMLRKDPDAAVRFQVARGIFRYAFHDREWSRTSLRSLAASEENAGVAIGIIQSLGYYCSVDRKFALELASQVLRRFYSEAEEQPTCVEHAYSLIADLYFHEGDEDAQKEIEEISIDPARYGDIIRSLLSRYRELVTIGSAGSAEDPSHAKRRRVLGYFRRVARASLEIFRSFDQKQDLTGPQRISYQQAARVIDSVVQELYFGSGAPHDSNGRLAGQPTIEQCRLFDETRDLLEILAGDCIVHTAYQLCEFFEWYVGYAPNEVFRLIALTVGSATRRGYALESLASSLVVRIVERYIADHADVFVDRTRRQELLDILDGFVAAGWPDARKLVYKISQIWS